MPPVQAVLLPIPPKRPMSPAEKRSVLAARMASASSADALSQQAMARARSKALEEAEAELQVWPSASDPLNPELGHGPGLLCRLELSCRCGQSLEAQGRFTRQGASSWQGLCCRWSPAGGV